MEFEQFLRDYAIYISVGVFLIIALFLIFYLLYPLVLKKKKQKPSTPPLDQNQFYLALGGKENVKNIELNGSRLSVELNDMNKYVRDQLRDLGVVRIITMKEKLILLVDESFQILVEKK